MMSNYKERLTLDRKNERIICQVLDRYLYSKDLFSNTGRTTDYQQQAVEGIDIYFSTSADTFVCDEKCAYYYANKNLQTFALELSAYSPKAHCRYYGWYLAPNKKANSYMFIYLNKCEGELFNFTSGDVHEVEVILVKKEAIQHYLDGLGFTKDKLMEINSDIADKHVRSWLYDRDGIRFHYSYRYEEKTINLLIPRKVLRDISEYNDVIFTYDEQQG